MRASSRPPGATSGGSSRFSSTFRLAKMPRSSGQMAMPRPAILLDVRFVISEPLKRTEPSRRSTMPMIDLSVVVLPAPLRPSSVTTSPPRTSKSTPCRMCDSPYQALSPLVASSDVYGWFAASAMPRPEVSLDHFRVCRDRLVIALGEDFAPLQHGDAVRAVLADRQV